MTQRVLAIDDSLDIHELVELALRTEGFERHYARNARQGYDMVKSLKPDLVLLDVMMPDVTGFDLCKQLKDDLETQHIPIIFLTGTTDTVNKIQGLELGAIDYVTKPFNAAELLARVRAALRTKRYQNILAERAQIDSLTALWNRAYFDYRLKQEVAVTQRTGNVGCLCMFDVDHFKDLNDEYGHAFGDQVLERLGELLLRTVRLTDAACRYGGEEFAIIMPNSDLQQGVSMAGRVLEEVSRLTFRHPTMEVGITVSGGLACTEQFAGDILTPAMLLTAADEALYRSKAAGRNRVQPAKVNSECAMDPCAEVGAASGHATSVG